MSSPTHYTYQPLTRPTSIRIIALEPSLHAEAPLHCTIIHADTEKIVRGQADDLYWDAISYVWGESPQFTSSLLCDNGVTHIAITPNVDQILRSLRKGVKTRYLWIDAICLNQSDHEEKRVQIPRMSDLYRLARKVHLCLSDVPRPSALFHLLRWIKTDKQSRDRGLTTPTPWNDFIETSETESLNEDEQRSYESLMHDISYHVWLALNECKEDFLHFLRNPFWYRRWIVQEVLLGQNLVIRCGSHTLPFDVFAYALQSVRDFSVHGSSFAETTALHLVLARAADIGRSAPTRPNLLHYLNQFGLTKCLDPQDRLFALRGLVSRDVPATPLHLNLDAVDYNEPWEKIYEQVALTAYSLLIPVDSDHLRSATPSRSELNNTIWRSLFAFGSVYHSDASLPSWIPAWNHEKSQTLHKPTPSKTSPKPGFAIPCMGVLPVASVELVFCSNADGPFTKRFGEFLARDLLSLEAEQRTAVLTELLNFFDGKKDPVWASLYNIICASSGDALLEQFRHIFEMEEQQRQVSLLRVGSALMRATEGEADPHGATRLNALLQNTAICFARYQLHGWDGPASPSLYFVPIGTARGDLVRSPVILNKETHEHVVFSPVRIDALDTSEEGAEPRRSGKDTITCRILGQAVPYIHETRRSLYGPIQNIRVV